MLFTHSVSVNGVTKVTEVVTTEKHIKKRLLLEFIAFHLYCLLSCYGRQMCKDINYVYNLLWCYAFTYSQTSNSYQEKYAPLYLPPPVLEAVMPTSLLLPCPSCPFSSLLTITPLLWSLWICPLFLAMCFSLNLVATLAFLIFNAGKPLRHICYWLLAFLAAKLCLASNPSQSSH